MRKIESFRCVGPVSKLVVAALCAALMMKNKCKSYRRIGMRNLALGIALAAIVSLFLPTTRIPIANAASAAGAEEIISLKAEEFPAKAASLLNKQVEVSGAYEHPGMVGPKSAGVFKDPVTGKTFVQLTVNAKEQEVLGFLLGRSQCKQKPCPGIFARGHIVMNSRFGEPVLDLNGMSFSSKVKAQADQKALIQSIADKDRFGVAKPMLPPHSVPTQAGWKAWSDRVPGIAPGHDKANNVWANMQAYSRHQTQVSSDARLVLFRGPSRPADFETYYRGVRDTGLANLFAKFPYQGSRDEFPRVAIIIEEKPRPTVLPDSFFKGSGNKTDYCWRFRAKLWIDATHGQDIAPFNWCFSETRFNVPYSRGPLWGQVPPALVTLSGKFTGKGRTAGPIPPYTPLPITPEYKHTYSYAPVMVGNVLMDMGFNWDRGDGRVWFLEQLSP